MVLRAVEQLRMKPGTMRHLKRMPVYGDSITITGSYGAYPIKSYDGLIKAIDHPLPGDVDKEGYINIQVAYMYYEENDEDSWDEIAYAGF